MVRSFTYVVSVRCVRKNDTPGMLPQDVMILSVSDKGWHPRDCVVKMVQFLVSTVA
jgi:hypothetical protein